MDCCPKLLGKKFTVVSSVEMSKEIPMVRIMFVVNTSWFFISHRLSLAVAAMREGYEVHLATQVYSESDRQRILSSGIRLHEMPMPRASVSPFLNAALLCRLVALYWRVRPTIVHHVTMKPNLLGGIAARLLRVPASVYAISGLGYSFTGSDTKAIAARGVLMRSLKFALGHRCSRVIFQNPDDLHALVVSGIVSSDRAVLIRGAGVELRLYTSLNEAPGRLRVLMASRLLREKGVEEYIKAAAILKEQGVEADFLLAGAIDMENPGAVPESEIRAHVIRGDVEWLGNVSDMVGLMASVHVVCLPSYYGEGIPKVLIEAAAASRAIVTTDTPGCREIVADGVNGILIEPKSVSALAQAIRKLVLDPGQRVAMGRRGRELVERDFALEKVVGQTMAIYRTLSSASI